MDWRYAVGINEYKRMDTRELRENFLIDNLFVKDALTLVYWETDRTVTGAVVPMAARCCWKIPPD